MSKEGALAVLSGACRCGGRIRLVFGAVGADQFGGRGPGDLLVLGEGHGSVVVEIRFWFFRFAGVRGERRRVVIGVGIGLSLVLVHVE